MLFAPECSRLAPPGGPRCSATSNRSWPASTSRATTRSCGRLGSRTSGCATRGKPSPGIRSVLDMSVAC